MNPRLIYLCYLIIGLTACTAPLQGRADVADTLTVHFRQSRIFLDPAYRGNAAILDTLASRLASPELRLKRMSVTGGASPEGSVKFNQYLSEQRAAAIFSHVTPAVADSVATTFTYLGRDWHGLRRMVEADPSVPSHKDVLRLLDRITAGELAHPLAQLKALDGGTPYRYMYTRLFPRLRESHLVMEYEMPFPSQPSPQLPPVAVTQVPSTGSLELPFPPSTPSRRPWYLAIKTNMLYDAALIPNIGAEYYIGRGWSLMADWMYGWWDRDATHFYWRAYGGTVGARKWWGRAAADKPLTGHHLGAFAGFVTYDFETGHTGYMGGLPGRTLWDRCNFICGLEYGYSLPIARRLNIDFTIGLGYLGGKVIKYVPYEEFYEWQSVKNFNWIGPTKLEVALVWLIGHGNTNAGKGGGGR